MARDSPNQAGVLMPVKPDILLSGATVDLLRETVADNTLRVSFKATNGWTNPGAVQTPLGILGIKVVANPVLPEGVVMLMPAQGAPVIAGNVALPATATPIVSDDAMNIEASPRPNPFRDMLAHRSSCTTLPATVDAAISDLLQAAEAHSLWAPDYGDITTSTASTTEPVTVERVLAALAEFQAKVKAETLFVQGTRLDLARFREQHALGGYGCELKVVGTEEDEIGRVMTCKGDWPLDVSDEERADRVVIVDVLPQKDIERLEREGVKWLLDLPLSVVPVRVAAPPRPRSARERYGLLLERLAEIDADPDMHEATEAEVDELDAILAEGLFFHEPADFLGEE